MTREGFQPYESPRATAGFPWGLSRESLETGVTEGEEYLRQTRSGRSGYYEGTHDVALSPSQRLVVSCLAAKGGTERIVRLARAVSKVLGRENGGFLTPEQLQETYLNVHTMIVDDLSERGIVSYCDDDGTVRLV